MRFLLFLSVLLFAGVSFAAEPLLKPNDVIAIVGGEDMVVASELGYLETILQVALPKHHLKFRSLAWEGDTVFEQRRDLNYPSLEAQLEKIGATIVLAQFGSMESLAGEAGIADFKSAYERLIQRLSGPSKRRIILIAPNRWGSIKGQGPSISPKSEDSRYRVAVSQVGERLGLPVIYSALDDFLPASFASTRDGVHLHPDLHGAIATGIAMEFVQEGLVKDFGNIDGLSEGKHSPRESVESLRALVVAKNRLWFNYARPQNWAFLAGDRTNQPSSRDHIDRNKRWFPEELEHFVPLIVAKENEIWAAAAKLNP